jgi:hypothetical protein
MDMGCNRLLMVAHHIWSQVGWQHTSRLRMALSHAFLYDVCFPFVDICIDPLYKLTDIRTSQ